MKNLVIIESPNKRTNIAKFLKNSKLPGSYEVAATVGHILNLEDGHMAIDIDNQYAPQWQKMKDKKKIISELKTKIKQADHIYLATDPDLAGDFIAWSVLHIFNIPADKYNRVTFSSITAQAITDAFKLTTSTNRKIDMNKVYAEQTRRLLDRLIGFSLSPLVIKMVGGRSAGRCQSPITRLVYEKDLEIEEFQKKEQFAVTAEFNYKHQPISTKLNTIFTNEKETTNFLNLAKDATFYIKHVKQSSHTKSAPIPYKTRTLLTDLSGKTGMSVKSITSTIQSLFSQGYITYIRSDSTSIDPTFIPKIETSVTSLFSKSDIDISKRKKLAMKESTKKGNSEQQGHECIRATDLTTPFSDIENATHRKIYVWIWKRTIASMMKPQSYDTYTLQINLKGVKKHQFIGTVDDVTYEGYMKVYTAYDTIGNSVPPEKSENPLLSIMKTLIHNDKNIKVDYSHITANQSYTSPPAYYNEASLLTKLDKLAIGRSSTYSGLISTIVSRDYVKSFSSPGSNTILKKFVVQNGTVDVQQETKKTGVVKNKFKTTPLGQNVVTYLCSEFNNIMDYKYTSKIEHEIIKVEEGTKKWYDVVHDFYTAFSTIVQDNKTKIKENPNHGKRLIGLYNDEDIYSYKAKHCPVIQIGAKKPTYVKIPKGKRWDKISLKSAIELIVADAEKPKNPNEGKPIVVYEDKEYYASTGAGKRGSYISLVLVKGTKKDNAVFIGLKDHLSEGETHESLSGDRVKEICKKYMDEQKRCTFEDYENFSVMLKQKKSYYLHLTNRKKPKSKPIFVSVPKTIDPLTITQDQINELIRAKLKK
jgi:DNA topoisomerase-1